jgi:hypothetical protein
MAKKNMKQNKEKVEEKKLPLGIKIISGVWLLICLSWIISSFLDFISNGYDFFQFIVFLFISILCFFIFSFSIFKGRNFAKHLLIVLGCLCAALFIACLPMAFWIFAVAGELMSLFVFFLFSVFVLWSAIYLWYNKKANEFFKSNNGVKK